MSTTRRLAGILAADVAGYCEDEEGTLAALRSVRRELGDPKITEHWVRIEVPEGLPQGRVAETVRQHSNPQDPLRTPAPH